jgi:hypothetical protein
MSGVLVTLTNPFTIAGWLAIAGQFFYPLESKLALNPTIRPMTKNIHKVGPIVPVVNPGCLLVFGPTGLGILKQNPVP